MNGTSHRPWIALGICVALAAVLIGLLVWKPSPRRPDAAQGRPLVMYCAAGIKPPVEAVARQYEREYGVPVQLQYGGTGTLLANLRVAKVGDLFLAADSSFTRLAREQGLLAEVSPLARLRLVIAVRKGNPKNIRSLQDLLRAEVSLALANPEAASAGKVTQKVLEKAGQWAEAQKRAKVFKPTVTDVANDIKLGTVDAGVVWDATVRQYPELEMVRVPELDAAAETVSIGVLKSTSQPTAALRFARYLGARDKGLTEFARLGYEPADGDVWAETPELVLYSGAMNRVAVDETLRQFEQREGVRITRIYNGCGILVAQMKAGGRPDAYLTCDRSFVPPVADLFPEPPVEVSDSRIVILTPKGNPKNLRTLADLAQKGLRVGVANAEQSTLGALTRRLLEQEGILDQVMANVVTQTPTADMLVNQMRTGALDAVVVYISNTTFGQDQLGIVPLPQPGALAVQTYSVAKNTPHRQLAARLLETLKSAASRTRYETAGFHWRGGNPPPGP